MLTARCAHSRGALLVAVLALASLAGCGSRSELIGLNPPGDVVGMDARDAADAVDAVDAADAQDAQDVRDVQDVFDGCVPVDDQFVAMEICGNGVDDNRFDGIDENCPCMPGAVQPCFGGPPGRRNVGACRDGTQTCTRDGTWGACAGGINPREDICNGQDNSCNGCSQQNDCPILCPSPGDPRVRDGVPFRPYVLNGRDFYLGPARSFSWTVRGGPCDDLTPTRPSFELTNANSVNATFTPRLSGDYTVTLNVMTEGGRALSCTWVVHIEGPGLRIEMCWPENTTVDLDLFLHEPGNMLPWYVSGGTSFQALPNSCGWHNCEAEIRGSIPGTMPPVMHARANWGYANSPLSECVNGPQGSAWRMLGFCANPRLDIDNNLSFGVIGLPENINVDNPRDGDSFRIMVENFSGERARPLINVYCSGRRVATYGEPGNEVMNFTGQNGNEAIGAMWRVADVRVRVDAMGRTTGCDVTPLHPTGMTRGYLTTRNDPSY